jgi:uncharacterized protein involved in oxidation of intracellular sulfur
MKLLIVLNESPYGSERAFNALRLAAAHLADPPGSEVWLFLLSDGVYCAMPNQLRPDGSTCIEAMLKAAIEQGAKVKACITCMDHRGLFGTPLVEGVEHGNMADLAAWTAQADQVVPF